MGSPALYARRAAASRVVPFPEPVSHGSNTGSGDGTIPFPSGIVAGSLLIARVGTWDTAGSSIANIAGFTQLINDGWPPSEPNDGRLYVAYKFATGSEEGTNATIDVGTGDVWAGRITRYNSHHVSAAPEISTTSKSEGTSAPDPPSLSPSWGSAQTAWEAIVAHRQGAVSAYPANYTDGTNDDRADIGIGVAYRKRAASSEDPGAFTISASGETAAVTLAIRPGG